jgi:hypothetical protein
LMSWLETKARFVWIVPNWEILNWVGLFFKHSL